jgi:GNAT superfamily N-acetyltransferase
VELVFEVRRYDDPDVSAAIAQLQLEYVRRYGSEDVAAVDPLEFAAPDGLFLVCLVDGSIAAMGGWRRHDEDCVEIKRMYVPERLRRRGLARAILAELERRAAEAGYRRVVLNTGLEQPEAVAMYETAGYSSIPGFGHYADAPLAVFFGKEL